MKFLMRLRDFGGRFFHSTRLFGDVEEELDAHIELRADDLERSGLTQSEAERRARIEFGGRTQYEEECHEAFGGILFPFSSRI